MRIPANPVVHEIFTWVWLHDLGEQDGRVITLGDVPGAIWDEVAGPGVDVVWLMGVWERSPEGAAIARANPAMSAAQREVLPDVIDDDVVGSAYCIRNYRVDVRLGGDDGLATAREALAARGVALVLDFVPNHVAPDHPWVTARPEYFVRGSIEDLAQDPDSYLAVGDEIIARGRDPYFPAWPEVLQLDASRSAVRRAATDVVLSIAARCDGVRCDMAMLVLDNVFSRTWVERERGSTAPSPDEQGGGYWPTVIGEVRARHPDFVFWAEAYWDLEPVLVDQGFDACYDKRLYDRLVQRESADSVRAHLSASPAYQQHTVRFVENHDEPRLAALLDPLPARAAAVVAMTLPGAALFHEGQADGRRIHVPMTLGRRPAEVVDRESREWYGRLMVALDDGMRRGTWALAGVDGWPDNRSCDQLVAWTWTAERSGHLVVVNLSGERADGVVRLGRVGSGPVILTDLLSGDRYERDGDRIATDGLYVSLSAHGVHLLRW